MLDWLQKIKIAMCCGSKCTVGAEDTNGDGIPDKINIELEKK